MKQPNPATRRPPLADFIQPDPPAAGLGPEGIAVRMAWARARAGVSLRGLGEVVGGSAATLGRIERAAGGVPHTTIWAVARALGVRAGWLAFGEGEVHA